MAEVSGRDPVTIPDPVAIYAGDPITGDEWSYELDNDDDTPMDLSGYTWAAMWRPYPTSTDVVTLTVDATDANVGVLRIHATAEDTRAMTPDGVWDLQATAGEDELRTWLRGTTTWRGDVTRS